MVDQYRKLFPKSTYKAGAQWGKAFFVYLLSHPHLDFASVECYTNRYVVIWPNGIETKVHMGFLASLVGFFGSRIMNLWCVPLSSSYSLKA